MVWVGSNVIFKLMTKPAFLGKSAIHVWFGGKRLDYSINSTVTFFFQEAQLHGAPWQPHHQKSTFPFHPILLPIAKQQLSTSSVLPHTPALHTRAHVRTHTPWFQYRSPVTQQWQATIGLLARKGQLKHNGILFRFLDPSHREPRKPNLSETLTLSSLWVSRLV